MSVVDPVRARWLTHIPPVEMIYRLLAEKQHLAPHRALGEVLADPIGMFCPKAAAEAVGWLQLDEQRKIGRFTRTELSQLATAIHRFWSKGLD